MPLSFSQIVKQYERMYGESATVTRRTLSLGAADSETGWYAKSFANSSISMIIRPKGSNFMLSGLGFYARHDITGFTDTAVAEGDEILDANSKYYSVDSVDREQKISSVPYYACSMTHLTLHADRSSTYGSSGTTVKDPRERMKTWLDTYITATHLKEDNGSTNATYLVCFSNPDYPIGGVLLTKGVDLIFACGEPESEPLMGFNHKPYGYEEKVPITVYTVDKSGLTAENLRWQAEAELRLLAETYPTGSLRTIASTHPNTQRYGGQAIYSQTYIFSYRRDTS